MPKVMITAVDAKSSYSSPSVVVIDCNTIEDAKELAGKINGTRISFTSANKTIHRIAEVLDV